MAHRKIIRSIDGIRPELGGLELGRRIRKNRSKEKLPLVLLTSMGNFLEDDFSDSHLFSRVASKPLKQSHLYNIFTDLFGEKQEDSSKSAEHDILVEDRTLNNRILVAEDNPVNQKLIIRMLKELGHNPDSAWNGNEVLQMLEKSSYDLIFMDINMPELDGLETFLMIFEKYPADKRPKIIALTTAAMEGDREKFLEAGMDDYLPKPFRLSDLRNIIQKWVQHPGSVSGPSAASVIIELDSVDNSMKDRLIKLASHTDPKFLVELFDSFLKSIPNLFERLTRSYEQKDFEEMEFSAHSIKGSAWNFGAQGLAKYCKQVEELAAKKDLKTISSIMLDFQNEYERVLKEVRLMREKIMNAYSMGSD